MARNIALVIALVAASFAAGSFWSQPARADVSVSGRLHLGDGAVSLDARIGDELRGRGGHRGHAFRRGHRSHYRDDRYRGHRPVLVVPYVPRERVILRETVVETPPPPVAAVPAPSSAPPPEPLDPRGQARTVAARGAASQPREWVLGDVLPADLPHVALAASAYGLPPPPPGQIYARVEGDVLRIDAGTRRIVAVVAR